MTDPLPPQVTEEVIWADYDDFVGTWTASVMESEGERVDLAMLGLEMTLRLDADGTATLASFGEEDASVWTYADGAADIDGVAVVLTADGSLCMEDEGDRILFVRGEAGGAGAPALPDAPQTVSDELSGYVGFWHAVYLSTGGLTGDPRTLSLHITLTLDADGTGVFTFGDDTPQVWYQDEESGTVFVGETADGVGMALTLIDGDFLQYGTQLGGYIMFSRDEDAVWTPAAAPTPDVQATQAPAAPRAQGGSLDSAYLERKFVAQTAEVSGFTMPAANLGGEYAVTLHADGKADFVMVNVPVNGLGWSLDEASGDILLDYYGTPIHLIPTEAGLDINYMDSMLLHCTAQP